MDKAQFDREVRIKGNVHQASLERARRTAERRWDKQYAGNYSDDVRTKWVFSEEAVILYDDYGWFQMENRDELVVKRDALLETPEDYRDRDAEWAAEGLTYEQLSRGY